MKRTLIVFIQTILLLGKLFAQTDSIWIDEVAVVSLKNRFEPTGSVIEKLDSINLKYPNYSAAQLLNEQAGLFVKSYGLNSLASLSLRGAGAQQTLVLWNGLPLQSPSLGQLDLSLIPSNLTQNIRIQYGGNSSSWGSGAIGGTVSFNNVANFNSALQVQYLSGISSFGGLQQQVKLNLSGKKFSSNSQLVYQKAQNNFPYKRADKLPTEIMQNNAFKQQAFMQSFYYKPKANHLFSTHLWLQNAYKEIPPLTTQNESIANQKDKIIRWMFAWDYAYKKVKSNTKLAYFKENQSYKDKLLTLHNTNIFHNMLAEQNVSFLLNQRHRLQTSFTNILSIVNIDAYQQVRHQNRFSGLLSYSFSMKKWTLQSSLRLQMIDKKVLLPIPLVGWNFNVNKNIIILGKISRDFRLPTLNDLYWQPGGNENLKPESGFSEEISIEYTFHKNKHHFSTTQALYNRNIKDWILWTPSTSIYWQANNINKVWSKGWESRTKYVLLWKKQQLEFNNAILYSSSTFQNNLTLPKIDKGEQLFYTPIWQTKNNVNYTINGFRTSIQHQWVGKSNGTNEHVASYNLINTHFSYQFQSKPFDGLLFFQLNNLLNKTYFVIERRPMPGINFQLGMQINFFKPLIKKP